MFNDFFDNTYKNVNRLSNSLDINKLDSIADAVTKSSNVFCTGLGSSSIAAQKMNHNLSLVGINSRQVEISDLMHGQLGSVKDNSIFLIFSKSANHEEIRKFIEHLKDFRIKLFLITENSSVEYLSVDSIIKLPPSFETDAKSILPTGSFINMCLFADMLLLTIQNQIGFNNKIISKIHPWGSLSNTIDTEQSL